MSAKVSYYTIMVFMGVLLDCVSDITDETIRSGSLHTYFETLLCHSDQLLFLWGCLPSYDKHARGIGIISIENCGEVDIHDVPLLQNLVWLWYSVAHTFIDTCTHRFRETLISEACWYGIVVLAYCHADIVYLLCRHARVNSGLHSVEDSGIDNSRASYAFYLFWRFYEVAAWYALVPVLPIEYFLVHLCERLPRFYIPFVFCLAHILISCLFPLVIVLWVVSTPPQQLFGL